MHFDFEETIVIYSLVTWMLALMHNAAGPTIGDEPEDPYQWLEDVTGAKALAWVKERNAESVKELTQSAGFQGARAPHPADPRFRGSDPGRRRSWGLITITSGATARTRAASGGARRSKSTRRPSRRGRSCSISTGWAEKRRKTGSGTVLKCSSHDYQRALVSLSRGGADASVVREFDLHHEGIRAATDSCCPKPRARSPGAIMIAFSWAPISARAR